MSQNDPKTTSLMTSVTKNPHPPTKKFFSIVIYQAGRSGWALEQLSSAIDGGARALVRQTKTAVLGWNQSTNISYPDSQSVKDVASTSTPDQVCTRRDFAALHASHRAVVFSLTDHEFLLRLVFSYYCLDWWHLVYWWSELSKILVENGQILLKICRYLQYCHSKMS